MSATTATADATNTVHRIVLHTARHVTIITTRATTEIGVTEGIDDNTLSVWP